MGSRFLDLSSWTPSSRERGCEAICPDLADTIYAASEPPDPALRQAFEVMARGTFVFLPRARRTRKGSSTAAPSSACWPSSGAAARASNTTLTRADARSGSSAMASARPSWLDLPRADSGIPTIGWRSPATCRALSYSIGRALAEGSFNPRYSPEATLREAVAALDELFDRIRTVFRLPGMKER